MTLTAGDFPPGTPLAHFFAWNERASRPDRRYTLARDPDRLAPSPAGSGLAERLHAAIGNPDSAAHADVFRAFEALEPPRAGPRSILVIRLSAFGDFILSLGPMAAIREHHRGDRITLLTTRPLAGFAQELDLFDEVMVDERPGPFALHRWLALRRRLRQGRFDRVYDLQTATRSALYAWLWRPGMPEWSGIAQGCSHPHASLERDDQHTIERQAEQLLMAGIYPTPLPALPRFDRALPAALGKGDFILLVPGSSPRHFAKRWPAARFALLARALEAAGYLPVVVGSAPEAPLAAAIREACPGAVDLVGRTDIALLAAIAQRARLTVGNDTGVCHLAAAAGCPLVVLFSRESDPARVAPRGPLVEILGAPDLNDLAAETVIAEALDILSNPRPHWGKGLREAI
ncbi:MAG TPA: glycosyltransferase family 9 protein [Stellaceae bacterium]|nr:glycosyltransferase family 9 protein [Stellaceae bacterium]